FWRAAYWLASAGLDEELLYSMFVRPYAGWNQGVLSLIGDMQPPPDLSFRSSIADELTSRFFRRPTQGGPFMLRVFARPEPAVTRDRGYRNQLVEISRSVPLPTVVETQNDPRLIAKPGDRVTSSTSVPGTIGGFLKDVLTGSVYAVTCGHVLTRGMAFTESGALGQCIHAAGPTPLPNGVLCSATCGHLTALDVGLIDVTKPVTNVAPTVAPLVSPGDIVDMHGATSGRKRYEIGGAVIEHTIAGGCWGSLHLFHAVVSKGLLAPIINLIRTPPPRPGDSGAWLLRDDE